MRIDSELPKEKSIFKWAIVLIVIASAIIFSIFFKNEISSMIKGMFGSQEVKVAKPVVLDSVEEKEKKSIVSFVAMGDILAHDTINQNAKTDTGYDFSKFFKHLKTAYEDSDIVFCNQEGLSSGSEYVISGYPSFNAPVEFASGLSVGAGCNLISLANNHIGDKGVLAINKTIDVWSDLNTYAVAGANKTEEDQYQVSYFTINNIKFSFLAFADFNNNPNLPEYAVNIYHNRELFSGLLAKARENSDFVIVSMHWGVEDSHIISDDQRSVTKILADHGVDLVIGTGPHVLQKAEISKRSDGGDMLIWYSLGNMLSSQLNLDQLTGGIAQLDIEKDINNKVTITNIGFTPTYMHYDWTETEKSNYDLLARKNAMIYLMTDASNALSRSLFNTTIDERMDYVKRTLGNEVVIK